MYEKFTIFMRNYEEKKNSLESDNQFMTEKVVILHEKVTFSLNLYF